MSIIEVFFKVRLFLDLQLTQICSHNKPNHNQGRNWRVFLAEYVEGAALLLANPALDSQLRP